MIKIILLVGPKGCGKTTLGRWIAEDVAKQPDAFLPVERIAQTFLAARGLIQFPRELVGEFYKEIAAEVTRRSEDASDKSGMVIFESTGVAQPETQQLFEQLKSLPNSELLLARVHASAATCGHRISRRDASEQVPCSQQVIDQIQAMSKALDNWPWDLEFDNGGDGLSREEVKEKIEAVVLNECQM